MIAVADNKRSPAKLPAAPLSSCVCTCHMAGAAGSVKCCKHIRDYLSFIPLSLNQRPLSLNQRRLSLNQRPLKKGCYHAVGPPPYFLHSPPPCMLKLNASPCSAAHVVGPPTHAAQLSPNIVS